MPFIDGIPGISQLKTIVQLCTCDTEGAKRTVVNFAKECPGLSQLTSIVQLATGDTKGAIETQKRCIGTVNNVVNGVPVVGHVKGILHHAVGDYEGRNQALNAATRSTVVASSGVAAVLVSKGIGAVPAAIAAGAIYDVTASLISFEAQGIVAALIDNFDHPSVGAILDLIAILVGDGLAGYSGGKIGDGMKPKKISWTVERIIGLRDRKHSRNTVLQVLSKINSIKCVTLKYETDGKAIQIANENNRRPKDTSNYYYPRVTPQEYFPARIRITAGHFYTEEGETFLERESPQGYLHDKYRDVIHKTTHDTLSELPRPFKVEPNRDPNWNTELKKELSWSLVLIKPGEEFVYTVKSQLNNERQGVYHSFIRHMNQWREVISFDSTLIDRISPLIPQIKKLTGNEIVKARNEFVEARTRLQSESPGTFYDVHAAFVEIQMSLHGFIREKLTSYNYLGRTVKENGSEQLHFKVMTKAGKPRVIVVCVSSHQLKTTPPAKVLITVFFKPWKQQTIPI